MLLKMLLASMVSANGIMVPPPVVSEGKIIVAVIDSGLKEQYAKRTNLCKSGHYDFNGETTVLRDVSGHGTNVSGLIDKYADNNNYCQLIYRYYDKDSVRNAFFFVTAIEAAIKRGAKVINLSGGGPGYSVDEAIAVKAALDKGVKIVAAAGNEHTNLNVECNYFPACYDKRIIVVGSLDENGKRSWFSNYGKMVTHYVKGENKCANGVCLSGTSQATAIVTGRLLNKIGVRNVSSNPTSNR